MFTALAFLTARTSIMANYQNYDMATEFLVYAHSAPGVKEVMRQIEELSYELPWYIFMSAQKEMRQELKELEYSNNESEFLHACENITDRIHCIDLTYNEEMDFKNIIRSIFDTEPWNFIATKPSTTYLWLCELHRKLKKHLR